MNQEPKRKLEAKILGLMSTMATIGGDMPYGLGNHKELREPKYKEKTDEGKFAVKFRDSGYYKLTVNGVQDVLKPEATIFHSFKDAKFIANKYGAKVVKIG